jgi:hypothetical protein
VLADLVKEFGKRVAASIHDTKAAVTQAQKDKAAIILPKVQALADQPVISTTNPNIKTRTDNAYFYKTGKKKTVPVSISRKPIWLTLLPALHIADKTSKGTAAPAGSAGVISVGHKRTFDPKAKDREALRKALSCKRPKTKSKQEQAHHLAPLELRNHPIMVLAESNGFNYNGRDNGECLLPPTHMGSHPRYTQFVRDILDDLRVQHPGGTWTPDLKKDFEDAMKDLRKKVRALNKSGTKVDGIS